MINEEHPIFSSPDKETVLVVCCHIYQEYCNYLVTENLLLPDVPCWQQTSAHPIQHTWHTFSP